MFITMSDLKRARRGLGDVTAIATPADKQNLTKQALSIFAASMTPGMDPVAIRSAVANAMTSLASYQPWTNTTDTWSGYASVTFGGGATASDSANADAAAAQNGVRWSSSQTVRSNLQQALENVMIKTGSTSTGDPVSSTWRPQTAPAVDVSTTDETVKNLPEELSAQAKCMARGGTWNGSECVSACDSLPVPLNWMCSNWKVTAGVVGLGLAALYVGPFVIGRYHAFKKA